MAWSRVTDPSQAEEAAEIRDYAARADAAEQSLGFGSLADKLRGALRSKEKSIVAGWSHNRERRPAVLEVLPW
jgi:hypothetical protein